MAEEFKFPDVGEGVTEGKLINWMVSEGDSISEDQSLAEVETDKAVVEVPSPHEGTILKLHAEEGDTIKVGNVIATIGEKGENIGEGSDSGEEESKEQEESSAEETGEVETEDKEPEEEVEDTDTGDSGSSSGEENGGGSVKATPAVRKYAEEKGVALSKVEGTGSKGHVKKADVERYLEEGGSKEETSKEEKSKGEKEEKKKDTSSSEEGGRVLATPSTRKFAREKDVDLSKVEGTGPGGRISREDVEKYLEGGKEEKKEEKEPKKETGKVSTGRPGLRKTNLDDYDFEKYGEVEREEASSVRQSIAQNMVESKYTAPHVTTTKDVIVSELWNIREEKKKHAKEEHDVHLTLLPFITQAVIGALEDYPLMNASYDEEKGEIVKKKYYNIGIAVATDNGLMVPVIKNADDKSIIELAREMGELSDKARNKELGLDDIRGGSFTITNWGAIGGEYGTPIMKPPEVGILGTGRVNEKPVAVDGELRIEKVLPLSLSFDHRIVDGAYASNFLMDLAKHLKDPDLILLDD